MCYNLLFGWAIKLLVTPPQNSKEGKSIDGEKVGSIPSWPSMTYLIIGSVVGSVVSYPFWMWLLRLIFGDERWWKGY